MATIICICNQKGGVGKTTTATTIAYILQQKGYNTLLIDTDRQRNSTDTFQAKSVNVPTIYDVAFDLSDPYPINDAIQHTPIGDIVAGDQLLKKMDQKLPKVKSSLFLIRNALQNLSGYDYVILDTAPADDVILENCLIAANHVIIPLTAGRYPLQGLADLYSTISNIKSKYNPQLNLAGILLVMYKEKQLITKEALKSLSVITEQIHTIVFDTKIRESVAVQRAQAKRKIVVQYNKTCTVSQDYIKFVEELLRKGI